MQKKGIKVKGGIVEKRANVSEKEEKEKKTVKGGELRLKVSSSPSVSRDCKH